MSLPRAPQAYSAEEQNRLRAELDRQFDRTRKQGRDIELTTDRLILKSPDGSRFSVIVADDGTLSTEAA